MVDGTAIGVVGVHVAEGDAATIGKRWRGRVATRVEARKGSNKSGSLSYAWRRCAARVVSGSYGWVESAGTKKVHEGCVYVGKRAAPGRIAGHRERAGWWRLAGENCIVIRRLEIGRQQVAANSVGVDRTIEMASPIEVVGQVQGKAVPKR